MNVEQERQEPTLQTQNFGAPNYFHQASLKLFTNVYQFESNNHQNREMILSKPLKNTTIKHQHRLEGQPLQKLNFDASNANDNLRARAYQRDQRQPKQTIQNNNAEEEAKSSTEMHIQKNPQVTIQNLQKRKFDQKNLKLRTANLHPFASSNLQQSHPKKRKKRLKGAKRLTKWWYEPKMRAKMNNAIAAVRVKDQSLQLVSASHNIPPRTLSRYVKASFLPESPFYVGQDKWRSDPFKIGQIRTCIAAMSIDGLGIQKASALYNVPHFALTRYLKESKENRESPFYFKPAPPATKHAEYLERVKEAIRCHRRGFYGGASLAQLLSLLYQESESGEDPGSGINLDGDPRDGGPAMLRPLLVMVGSLPEILTNVILTLRSYIFQIQATMQSGDGSTDTKRIAKPWLRSSPSVYGSTHGTILNDVLATILVAMRKHTSRAPIQILCLETVDKLSSCFPDIGLFESLSNGSRRIARELVTSYGVLKEQEVAVITAMAAHSARIRYGLRSLQDLRHAEAGPLDLSRSYPCNDASTRRFFGAGWAGHPSIYSRWSNKEYETTKPAKPAPTHRPTELTFEVGDMTRLLEPPMASVWLAAKYHGLASEKGGPVEARAKKYEDDRLRQLAMICCASSPKKNIDTKTNEEVGVVEGH